MLNMRTSFILATVMTVSLTACSTTKKEEAPAPAPAAVKPAEPQFAPNAMIQKLPEQTEVHISADELQKIVDNPKSKTIIIDARRPAEYAEGHIPRAVNLDAFTATEEDLAKTFPNKKANYVVYCAKGLRATAMHDAMVERGYKNVKTLGGLQTHWVRTIVKD